MIGRVLAGFLLLLLASSGAHAQFQPGKQCTGLTTTTFSATSSSVLMNCTFVAGPTGYIFVIITAQVSCAASGDIEITDFIGSGSSPVTGASFTGTIAGSVLTVTAMASGSGTPPFTIQSGQQLFDGNSGSQVTSGVTITTGGTGTGGTGTYNLLGSPGAVSTPETMWSLIPMSGTAISNSLDENNCVGSAPGQFNVRSIGGSYKGTPGSTYWLNAQIRSINGKSATFANPYMSILTF